MDLDDARLIFANRLRHARQKAELTQEALGVAAGLAPEVARTRINRYEKGVNECDLRTAKRLADALGMPLAAFFAETDELADAIKRSPSSPSRSSERSWPNCSSKPRAAISLAHRAGPYCCLGMRADQTIPTQMPMPIRSERVV